MHAIGICEVFGLNDDSDADNEDAAIDEEIFVLAVRQYGYKIGVDGVWIPPARAENDTASGGDKKKKKKKKAKKKGRGKASEHFKQMAAQKNATAAFNS